MADAKLSPAGFASRALKKYYEDAADGTFMERVAVASVTITGPVTVSNEVEVKNDSGSPIPVSGPLTDAQLRLTPVPVDVSDTTFAATVADGADVTQGDVDDAAVVTDAAGTLSAKLRGLVKHAYERMPAALGQGTMAQSLPVVVASNQSSVPVAGQAADGAAVAGNPVRIAGKDSAGNTQDALAGPLGQAATSAVSGRLLDPNAGESLTVKTANGVATASGDNVVLAAVAGKKIRVLSYALQCQETGTVVARFQDNATATNRTMPWHLVASATQKDGVVRNPGGGGHFYFETGDGVGLDLNLDSALDTAWEVTYVEVE